MNDEAARVALGHLVVALQDAVLAQTFVWDSGAREWVLQLLADAGLMHEDAWVRNLYHLSVLAVACVEEYEASRPDDPAI